jgi:hypothetical protein
MYKDVPSDCTSGDSASTLPVHSWTFGSLGDFVGTIGRGNFSEEDIGPILSTGVQRMRSRVKYQPANYPELNHYLASGWKVTAFSIFIMNDF